MDTKIRILDESISNIIAAGEVVENPAAMVKELVENSLDAGASTINIKVSAGGRNVNIVDDGMGMTKEDLVMCVEKHATSKISKKEDIFNLVTYGFRGEALASIASISKLSMESRYQMNETGHKISLIAGKVENIKEISRNIGTEINIEDLFFNTPVRKKFLRKDITEYGKIRSSILCEALANYDVSFSLSIDGKEVIRTSGTGFQNTIIELFSANIYKNLKKFHMGYLGSLDIVKSNKNFMFTYFNKRYAKSPAVDRAIMDGYYTKLMKGKYPFVILFLEIAPNEIDVNIHPSKKMVKFTDERGIYLSVRREIAAAVDEKEEEILPKFDIEAEKISGKQESLFSGQSQNIENDNFQKESFGDFEKKFNNNSLFEKDNDENISKVNIETENYINKNILREKPQPYTGSYNIIGQLNNMYILVERDNNLLIYDQHIIHERLLYEELKEKYYNKSILTQALLVPVIINTNYIEKKLIFDNIKIFEDFGFSLEEFGENEVLIRKVPVFDCRESIKNIFNYVLENLKNDYNTPDIREKIIISMSCKGAIKAGEKLSFDEMKILVKDLHDMGKYTCPHGRPIIVTLSNDELAKRFKRK